MKRYSENPIKRLFEHRDFHERAKPKKQQARQYNKMGRVVISPGISVTTMPGSLYSSILKVLARSGQLIKHESLFRKFMRSPTVAAACELFSKIAVFRGDLERYVRADADFKAHCQKRTIQYKNRAARGDKKYQRILKDHKICDARGRWIGDIDEAINILTGARSEKQVGKGKNVQILRRARLMFDTLTADGQQICVLYPQKHHRAYVQARNLVCPPPLLRRPRRNA